MEKKLAAHLRKKVFCQEDVNFNYLDHVTINACLSDHYGQAMDIYHDISLFTWNIMTRGICEGERTNNGFKLRENEKDYRKRLERVAIKISQSLLAQQKIAVMTLQEVPDKPLLKIFLTTLKNRLKDTQWDIDHAHFSKTGYHKFGQLTLVNKTWVQSAEPVALDEFVDLPTQTRRIQVTEIVLKGKGDEPANRLRIVNAHFVPNANIQEDIDYLLNSTNKQVVIAGDFNYDMNHLGEKYKGRCYHLDLSSISYDKGYSKLRVVDGFIFKFNVAT